ncbi:hypothetical protein SAMN03159488_00950, partial [Pseudomonas sp. NFIX10]
MQPCPLKHAHLWRGDLSPLGREAPPFNLPGALWCLALGLLHALSSSVNMLSLPPVLLSKASRGGPRL